VASAAPPRLLFDYSAAQQSVSFQPLQTVKPAHDPRTGALDRSGDAAVTRV